VVTHVLKKNDIIFAFSSSYGPYEDKDNTIGQHVLKHGDGVRDVAFRVEDAAKTWKFATSNGAKSVKEPTTLSDENGTVVIASV